MAKRVRELERIIEALQESKAKVANDEKVDAAKAAVKRSLLPLRALHFSFG